MEYDILTFTNTMREMMYKLFPFESDELNKKKHKNRTGHIRDVAFMNLPLDISQDIITFNIGSDGAETTHPYYHILQQAPTIRKRGKGTLKSRGSEMGYKNPKDRDFERVIWNGKTFSKEYTRNIRGERNKVLDNATQRVYYANGKYGYRNKDSNSYVNIHYQYIDQMLDIIAPELANMFGMKLKRKIDGNLAEDFAFQEGVDLDSVLEIFGSFE